MVRDPFRVDTARIALPLTAVSGAHVFVTECDTGCHDSFVSSTDSFIVTFEDEDNCAFVGNTRHFDNEFDSAGSEGIDGLKVDNIKPQKSVSSSRLDA